MQNIPTHPRPATLAVTNNLAVALKAFIIAVAVTALYLQDLQMIFSDALQNEATAYILGIPFIFLYLLYRKRKFINTVVSSETSTRDKTHLATLSGMLLCAGATIFYFYGSQTFTPLEYHLLTLPVFAAGLALILFGPQVLRQLAFPIGFLFLLTPPPAQVLYGLGSVLSSVSSTASSTLVNVFGIRSTVSGEYANPAIIMTRPDNSTIRCTIDVSCSGIYSLIGLLVFAAFTAYIIRDKPWKKAAIFLLGFPLIYLLNIVRITNLLVLTYYYDEDLAQQLFHMLGGLFLTFIGTLLLLAIAQKLLKTQLTAKPLQTCPDCQTAGSSNENWCPRCGKLLRSRKAKLRKADLAKIVAITISVILLISIQSPIFALAKGPTDILTQLESGQEPTGEVLPQINNHTLQLKLVDTASKQSHHEDATLDYAYVPTNSSQDTVWVLLEISGTVSSFHAWEACLVSWPLHQGKQPAVTQLDLRDSNLIENPPVIARFFAFHWKSYNVTEIVLYWRETFLLNTGNTTQQKYLQISLIQYFTGIHPVQQAENDLFSFGQTIASYWQPIRTWAPVVLMVSQNGILLATIPILALGLILTVYVMNRRKTKERNRTVYSKLSKENQQIVDALSKTQQQTIPTVNNVAATYQRMYNEDIDKGVVLKQLEKAAETGLVSGEIANQQDEPVLTWKANLPRLHPTARYERKK